MTIRLREHVYCQINFRTQCYKMFGRIEFVNTQNDLVKNKRQLLAEVRNVSNIRLILQLSLFQLRLIIEDILRHNINANTKLDYIIVTNMMAMCRST